MNGAEVANCARARHVGLPIIFATGYADADADAIEAAAGSSSTILRKPFDIEELETMVTAVLMMREGRRPPRPYLQSPRP
jgi:DNA-binding response OmpR family regulator